MPIRTGVSPRARTMNGDVTCSAAAAAPAFKIVRRPITAERCEAFISSSQNNLLLLTAALMRGLSKRKSSHLRFLVPGPSARIETFLSSGHGGRGSRRRVVCARYRTKHRARTGPLLPRRSRRWGATRTRAWAATPFMCQRDGKLCRGRPRRNVDDGTPRNWCRLLVLIFRDALTSPQPWSGR